MTKPTVTGILILMLSGTVSSVAQERVAINLITHSQVEIARQPTAIWPRIVDPSGWKQGLRLVRHAGPQGKAGEVFAAVDPAKAGPPAFFAENVELVPNQRRTIKLTSPSGTLIGFATWTLQEAGGRTVVAYDVYSETLLTPDQAKGMSAQAIAAQAREGYATNKKRFDAELLALKRLVESER